MQSERNRIRTRIGPEFQFDHIPEDHQRLADLNELLDAIADQQTRILHA
ncbi:MAG: hypothetical protein ACKVJU_19595 [Verrucomicrobiales bacterium]